MKCIAEHKHKTAGPMSIRHKIAIDLHKILIVQRPYAMLMLDYAFYTEWA